MPLRRFRRQYEQLSQFEKGKIIGINEAGWSARRIGRQLGHSDCVIKKCWNQWVQEMSFTRRPGSLSTEQPLRRPPHRNKYAHTANCFIGRHSGTGDTFIRDPCLFLNHRMTPR
ncbi:uncharacterized protein TNCV_2235151 [Trichonephila clavipes]|nr:uncharacterized protein TNCV_2235151 [Trichonephila clavipes]